MHASTSSRYTYTRSHAYLHARILRHDSRDGYMQTLVPSFSPLLPPPSLSLFLALFFAVAPFPLPLPTYRSFSLSRLHLAHSLRLSLSCSLPLRPPPLSTPSRTFYSFFLSPSLSRRSSLSLSLSSSASVSFYSTAPLSVFPKLLPLPLATTYIPWKSHRRPKATDLSCGRTLIAKREVKCWTSFARRPCRRCPSPRSCSMRRFLDFRRFCQPRPK